MADIVVFLDRLTDQIKREYGRRLDASAILLTNHIKELLSVDGTGVVAKGYTNRNGKRVRKGRLIYGANPSKPGEPPRLQTGRLRGSIAWERNGFVARIGTSVEYAPYLERGTSKMLPRPFLRRALDDKMDEIRAIISKPLDF